MVQPYLFYFFRIPNPWQIGESPILVMQTSLSLWPHARTKDKEKQSIFVSKRNLENQLATGKKRKGVLKLSRSLIKSTVGISLCFRLTKNLFVQVRHELFMCLPVLQRESEWEREKEKRKRRKAKEQIWDPLISLQKDKSHIYSAAVDRADAAKM